MGNSILQRRLSIREIAKRENVSVSAVKQRRVGALRKLRGQVEIQKYSN